ncbi:uncharacterized protein LOC129969311 [Argiope bruennichi]|uniref:uncharacterized protein LOC129969311 n=1 Tax=Argiope bruennichi TaxID=94029 RepID=UPI002494B218|nr:uncharacterized protein LOC129969311 [Argiope bruennichi]XP_055939925.1 uncharacterized protein LOC129969311 [Argiope bruennichi]XP_055939999.1 uncharacterized protein LOC129969311 [Argiope bruennichi]
MKIFVLLLCLALLGVAQALRRSDENFFMQHGIMTNCRGNTTFGSFSWCTMRCDNMMHPFKDCNRPSQLGCVCKRGYIPLDANLKKLRCVKLYDCPIWGEGRSLY